MAVNIAKLSAIATLDATQFSSGIQKMIGAVTPLRLAVGGALAAVGYTAVRAATGLARLTASGLKMGDALADAERMTGIAADRLATFHRAARLAGVGAGEFDEMIHRLNVNVGDAIQGDEKFANILKKAGVELEKITSLSPDETFLALADAIAKTGNAYERAHVAQAAFGRGGRRLLPMLSGGRAGYESLLTSTRALGAAPTTVQAQKIEKANDAIEDLTTALDGIKLKLAEEFAPALTTAAEGLLKFMERTGTGPVPGRSLLGKIATGGGGKFGFLGTAAQIGRMGADVVYGPGGGAAVIPESFIPYASPYAKQRGQYLNAQAARNAARRGSRRGVWQGPLPSLIPGVSEPNPYEDALGPMAPVEQFPGQGAFRERLQGMDRNQLKNIEDVLKQMLEVEKEQLRKTSGGGLSR